MTIELQRHTFSLRVAFFSHWLWLCRERFKTRLKIVFLQLYSHTAWHKCLPCRCKCTKGSRREALICIVVKWRNGVWAPQCCVELYCAVVLHISSAQKKLIRIRASIEMGLEVRVTYLWNWSWKRSRCPCKVSAGRPKVKKQIHCHQYDACTMASGRDGYQAACSAYTSAAWKAAWQWSGRGDYSPGWPGWGETADTGPRSMWILLLRCWADGSLPGKQTQEHIL